MREVHLDSLVDEALGLGVAAWLRREMKVRELIRAWQQIRFRRQVGRFDERGRVAIIGLENLAAISTKYCEFCGRTY